MERVRPVLSWVSSENVCSMALPFISDILQHYVFCFQCVSCFVISDWLERLLWWCLFGSRRLSPQRPGWRERICVFCFSLIYCGTVCLYLALHNIFHAPMTWFVWLSCHTNHEWLGCWTCDQQVMGSNLGLPAVECNPVNTRVPLSPSSIIWYQSTGGDALQLGK